MSSITADSKLTLFLWLEGFFPKQIVYFLLLKGLVDSPSQLYVGKTNDPRLSIKVLCFNGSAIVDVDPSDPKPAGKSTPCLRITDPTGKNELRWVHESSSIRLLLEELYPEKTPMIGPTPLERALMNDIHSTILQSITDSNYYIKNAAAVTTSWSGMRDEDRSLAVARHGKENHVRALLKAQEWAAESLEKGGWLTPGLDHPGLVDAALAGGARYMELSYSFDLFEDERLGLLKEW
ncbi:uncharacterized protein NECHADRAFT_81568 [Fusarium vanettenii 77-13-4]|uniref:GST N-terminal domain-containing protein n=1 Tax=Fusarium vanettenii (strain ATCC MYA-4622 / CBS 123669 / FGSC 9596 / NRRL 45880 / 77-13-4) TaxID=660122 RepID=C7Z962_FUSV7|nr:uncharacterized protein NECHADRAFT_81568 [Fusarium vanettenii 77-13-4]EEU39416.1 hypothetical protein NECHADRAFT_81568 [Fusarium vanettenii 77-13-4]